LVTIQLLFCVAHFISVSTDDEGDYHHLLTFKDVKDTDGQVIKPAMRDVEALVCVFAIAIFMNALDKRTYIPLAPARVTLTTVEQKRQRQMDLNAIPVLERRHCCYIRGLAFDIMGWFSDHYELRGDGMLPDSGDLQLVPQIAKFGRDMVRYKCKVDEQNAVGACNATAFQHQVEMALFGFHGFEEHYKEMVDVEEELGLPFSFKGYDVVALDKPHHHHKAIDDYFKAGRNRADNKYFYALNGSYFIFIMILLTIEICPQEIRK